MYVVAVDAVDGGRKVMIRQRFTSEEAICIDVGHFTSHIRHPDADYSLGKASRMILEVA